MDNLEINQPALLGFQHFISVWLTHNNPVEKHIPTYEEWEKIAFDNNEYQPNYQKPTPNELLEIFPESISINKNLYRELKEEISTEDQRLKELVTEEAERIYKDDNIKDKVSEVNFIAEILHTDLINKLEKRLKKFEFFVRLAEWKRKPLNSDIITDTDIVLAKAFQLGSIIQTNRAGFMLCPFHEEQTPSFKYYKKDNRFHCFSCGADGDIIDFVMKQSDLDFISAVKKILNK